MKLIKSKNRSNGVKTWYRYKIDIPCKLVEDLGWDKGPDIEITKTDHGITLTLNED